jgi:hypothetical protein
LTHRAVALVTGDGRCFIAGNEINLLQCEKTIKNGFKEISKRDLPETFPIMKVDTRFYQYEV